MSYQTAVAAAPVAVTMILRNAVEQGAEDAGRCRDGDQRRCDCLPGARSENAWSIPRAPMTLDTIFRIASMTKPVTSVAVMQLVEAGRVKLDSPAAEYLPDIAKAQVIDHIDAKTGEPGDAPSQDARNGSRVTLTHFRLRVRPVGFGAPYEYRTKVLASGVDAAAFKEPLMFDPGIKVRNTAPAPRGWAGWSKR